MSGRILIVDDEESIRFTFNAFLSDAGYNVETADSLDSAMFKIESESFDAIFLDILLGRESGIKVLQASREKQPNTPVIMVTGAPEISTAAEAVRLGAFDYITKPLHQDELLRQAKLALEHKKLVDQREMYQLRMAAVFQGICEGVMIFNEEMKLVEINDAAVEMFGIDSSLLGLGPREISTHCPPLKLLQGVIEERCEGEIFRMETINSANQPLTLGLTMAPLASHDHRELGTVLVLRDETKSVRAVA